MPYRRPYKDHKAEFVERKDEIAQIIDWAKKKKKRLLTVIGLPGIGKSWLLEETLPQLNNPDNLNTLWINVPKPEEISAWLKALLLNISNEYPNVPAYDAAMEVAVLLEHMAAVLCAECNGDFYLVFDKGDELFRGDNQDDWREFERIVIEPLARLDCIRFIIALHDQQRIQTWILRRSSESLTVEGFKNSDAGLNHIRRLLPYALNPLPKVTAERVYEEYLPGYGWEHPGLNAYLICECLIIKDNKLVPNFGQPDFLADVLEALLNNLPPDVPQTINLLTQVAIHCQKNRLLFWTPVDIQEICGLTNSNAWQKIDEWRTFQLIVEEEGGGFNIEESLCELVLAADNFGR